MADRRRRPEFDRERPKDDDTTRSSDYGRARERARSGSPDRYGERRRHRHKDERHLSRRPSSRDVASRKRYALDELDFAEGPRRDDNDDNLRSYQSHDRKRGRSTSPSVTAGSNARRHRSWSQSSSVGSLSDASTRSEDSRRRSKRSRQHSRSRSPARLRSRSPSQSKSRSKSRHKSKRKDKERDKESDRDKERDKERRRKKRKDKERKKDKGIEERRSVLTGKKIKLKVHKDPGDHERDANRQDLLQFLNSTFE